MKKKIYVVNFNDIIPDLSEHFDIVDTEHVAEAKAIILWNDVVAEYAALCKEARGFLGVPTIVFSHGRMALKDYICQGRVPMGDYAFAWTDHETKVAVDDGWPQERVFNVGCPIWRYIPEDHNPDGKTVLFFPTHKWVKPGRDDQINKEYKRIWKILSEMKGIRPVAKLLKNEFNEIDWPGETVWTNRRQKNHLEVFKDLFRNASCLILQAGGTPSLFANALGIPVIQLRNGLSGDQNPEFLDGVNEVREQFLTNAIKEAIKHPKEYTKDAGWAVSRDMGDKEYGLKIVENMAEKINHIIDTQKKTVYIHQSKPLSFGTFVGEHNACDYYRVTLPLSKIAANTNIKCTILGEARHEESIREVVNSNVIILTRFTNPTMLSNVEGLMKNGSKVLIDYDDNIFRISPYSPHYDSLGQEEFTHTFPNGDKLPVWVDGQNINLAENKMRLDAARQAMGSVNGITVTTDILKGTYEPLAKSIGVLPNSIDPDLWKPASFQPRNDIRLFWGGGASHFEDWTLLEPVLPVIFDKYKNVKLVIMGNVFPGTIKKLPKDRIETHEWVDVQAYPYKMNILDFDIALIPLRDSEFNRNKSCIKFVEASALGKPSVVSYVSPYKEAMLEDASNGMFIENNHPLSWIEGISTLIEDEKMRRDMGQIAREVVLDRFDINKNYQLWIDYYTSLL
jgi:hypothetical protein